MPDPVDQAWVQENTDGTREPIQPPPMTGRLLMDTLKQKSKKTAAGRDSWHMSESPTVTSL